MANCFTTRWSQSGTMDFEPLLHVGGIAGKPFCFLVVLLPMDKASMVTKRCLIKLDFSTYGDYATYNFAVHGYGTHQMLAAIENGLVASSVKEDVRYVFYQAIYPEHLYRLAGLRSWGEHGPKYILDSHRQPLYVGHFDDDMCQRWICRWIHRQFDKSVLITRTSRWIQASFEVDDALFVAMV